jgi:hypothetical protein
MIFEMLKKAFKGFTVMSGKNVQKAVGHWFRQQTKDKLASIPVVLVSKCLW